MAECRLCHRCAIRIPLHGFQDGGEILAYMLGVEGSGTNETCRANGTSAASSEGTRSQSFRHVQRYQLAFRREWGETECTY